MDGVLGVVNTDHIPDTGAAVVKPSSSIKKPVRAKDLQVGQTIRFEYGMEDNWMQFTIREIHVYKKQVVLIGKGGYQDDYSFRPEEMVEVIS